MTGAMTPSLTAIARLMLMSGLAWTALPFQVEFRSGWRSSARATKATRQSVTLTDTDLVLFFFWYSSRAPALASRTTKKCGTFVQDCVVRSAMMRAMVLSGCAAFATTGDADAAVVPLNVSLAASTSSVVMLPSGPVPLIWLMSTPCSLARRRAFGESLTGSAEVASGDLVLVTSDTVDFAVEALARVEGAPDEDTAASAGKASPGCK